MKKAIALLLALAAALCLTGCFGLEPKAPDEAHAIKVLPLIRRIEATDFPVDAEFTDNKVTRFQLAQAIRQAAENEMDAESGAAAGLGEDKHGCWSRSVHLEGTAAGFTEDDLWIEMTCGLTENVIRVTAHKGREGGVCYVRGRELYQMIRHWNDRDMVLDQEDYATFKKQVDQAVEKIYWEERAKGQPYTGWEVTRFEWLTSYVDKSENTTIHIYAVDYAMKTDDPEKVKWSEGMSLDSQGRVENVGDFGRLAARWWWWGEKYETAPLSKDRDVTAEFEEARDALNELNPRD
jgi:hypothetical protein